jgi:hypothetical protein
LEALLEKSRLGLVATIRSIEGMSVLRSMDVDDEPFVKHLANVSFGVISASQRSKPKRKNPLGTQPNGVLLSF